MATKRELLDAAMRLSDEDRLDLGRTLLGTVPDVEPAAEASDVEWRSEIEKRAREVLDGSIKPVSWTTLEERLQARLKQ